jgi:hypothetical protein
VLDFVPRHLHPAIRQNKTLQQGNIDATMFVQAALDFVGCDTTKTGPQAARSLGSIHFPGGEMPALACRLPACIPLRRCAPTTTCTAPET